MRSCLELSLHQLVAPGDSPPLVPKWRPRLLGVSLLGRKMEQPSLVSRVYLQAKRDQANSNVFLRWWTTGGVGWARVMSSDGGRAEVRSFFLPFQCSVG